MYCIGKLGSAACTTLATSLVSQIDYGFSSKLLFSSIYFSLDDYSAWIMQMFLQPKQNHPCELCLVMGLSFLKNNKPNVIYI